ncbi:amidase [Gryllotalpicola protaetiae]|uniref:Amidase n=1 Tax=Gryllotalpicola protaetiae TaxID=2419771 RepID=A0A387BJR7_9MICO|nr:amidase [Gryllotalpicola protaetiae]AYG04355.1 amidase [Gryllotalpicola protaetiae]
MTDDADELHEYSALEQWQLLQSGQVSPVELTEAYLERIETLNDRVGAFVTVLGEEALERARFVETSVPRTAPLWGLPLGDKDLWNRAGVPTGFGSRSRTGFVPDVSDEVVEQLDAAGAISLGKTAVPEFGMPAYTETLVGPPARNPWQLDLNAGGSSGGAAAAVAAGMLPFAPGSDGGGSIRIPAAACGLVGLKPGRGLVPSSLDLALPEGLVVNGSIARTTADAALLLDGMIGRNPDGTIGHHYALRAAGGDEPFLSAAVRGELGDGTKRFQLGVMTSSAWDAAYEITTSPEAQAALAAAVAALGELGHGIEETSLDPDPTYAPAFTAAWKAGAAAVPFVDEGFELDGPLMQWLVREGRALSAPELHSALVALRAFERRFIARLAPFDAVLTPTLAMTPRPNGWWDQADMAHNFEQQCQYTPFTSMVNVSGLPAISVPVHQTEATPDAPVGLPMGVQLIGRPGGERTLLALAAQLERKFRWRFRRPPVW